MEILNINHIKHLARGERGRKPVEHDDQHKNQPNVIGLPWHPKTHRLLRRDGGVIVQAIKNHPRFKDLMRMNGEINELSDKSYKIEKRWAKVKRLQRTLETIALAANLLQVASPDQLARYESLVHLEMADLTGPYAPPVAANKP